MSPCKTGIFLGQGWKLDVCALEKQCLKLLGWDGFRQQVIEKRSVATSTEPIEEEAPALSAWEKLRMPMTQAEATLQDELWAEAGPALAAVLSRDSPSLLHSVKVSAVASSETAVLSSTGKDTADHCFWRFSADSLPPLLDLIALFHDLMNRIYSRN